MIHNALWGSSLAHIVFLLKVPLVIFKREKEVARKLEFDGLYITEQPSEDDIKGQWDRLVINTQWVTDEVHVLTTTAFNQEHYGNEAMKNANDGGRSLGQRHAIASFYRITKHNVTKLH